METLLVLKAKAFATGRPGEDRNNEGERPQPAHRAGRANEGAINNGERREKRRHPMSCDCDNSWIHPAADGLRGKAWAGRAENNGIWLSCAAPPDGRLDTTAYGVLSRVKLQTCDELAGATDKAPSPPSPNDIESPLSW
ncbi:hypothetical protein [Metapseudomonas otitidis]|uniref:hypothetical protein n=1 Tax=Metapseudomonas otitidis TaxID=319939 RepID=UPI0013DEF0F0|nr:hypothetical protein [Pseudomonas otitidis]